ncbi:uncharacterized protein EI97DRAFT_498331 [Westerdykella ornata]|uniref:Uncharacterized protein n=1 Tax=Westerdykella ornata TaxID=318751 RepID=A0A6A6JTW8_WESOR|nr:uncharacterized protein EI97DRAFT_498331 [Westerdykella ornata]KAF2280051.1 hypothetical protein EI97DRAFT_498331 [Westerdykella ornata]
MSDFSTESVPPEPVSVAQDNCTIDASLRSDSGEDSLYHDELEDDADSDDTDKYWAWAKQAREERNRTPVLYEIPLFCTAIQQLRFLTSPTEDAEGQAWPIKAEDRCNIHGDGSDSDRPSCSVCVVEDHIEILQGCVDAWLLLRGPSMDKETWCLLGLWKRTWHWFAQFLATLEASDKPDRHQALRLATASVDNWSPGARLDPITSKMSPTWRKKANSIKTVSFTHDTQDFDTHKSRNRLSYNRKSSLYHAGRYAALDPEGWQDTSWMSSLDAGIAQFADPSEVVYTEGKGFYFRSVIFICHDANRFQEFSSTRVLMMSGSTPPIIGSVNAAEDGDQVPLSSFTDMEDWRRFCSMHQDDPRFQSFKDLAMPQVIDDDREWF